MKRLRKFIKIFAVFLISTIGIIALLLLLINLPFTDRIVSNQVNGLFNRLELPLHIQRIRTVLPNKVRVEGVTISGTEGDTIIQVMDMEAHIKLPAILKNTLKMKKVYLAGILVDLNNDSLNTGINIGKAFSGKDKTEAEKPKKQNGSWEIDIRSCQLINTSFKLDDPSIGIHIDEEIENLKLSGFHLSLLNRSMVFKGINLKNGLGGIKISPRLIPPKTEKSAPWNFGFKTVQVNELDFTFNQVTDSLLLNLHLKEGLIRTRMTDFTNNQIDAGLIKLEGADAKILTGNAKKTPESTEKLPPPAFPWDIVIDETNLQKVKLVMGLYSHPDYSDTISTPLIKLDDMHLVDTRLNNKSAEVLVKKLGFELANGFLLKQMRGDFASNQESTHLDFKIETENSQTELKAKAGESIFEMLENPDKIRKASVSFKNTSLSLLDIFYFDDDLRKIPSLTTLSSSPIILGGEFLLDQTMATLSAVSVAQGNNFNISLDGSVRDPLQIKKARGNLVFEISSRDSIWLKKLMREFDKEDDYTSLTSFSLGGSISDTMGYSGIDLKLQSSLGNMDLSGTIDLQNEDFDLKTSFRNLLPGKLLKEESLGSVSGSGAISGRGFKPDSLSAKASLLLDSLVYKNYQYTGTSIIAEALSGIYEITLQVDDPNLKTGLNTTLDRRDSSLMLIANGTLFAQLEQIHLTSDTVSVETKISASYSKTPRTLDTEMSLQNIRVLSLYEETNIQGITAQISTDSIETHLHGEADFFTADIKVGEPLKQVGAFLKQFQSYLMTFVDSADVEANTRISKLPATNITGNILYHEALGMIIQDTGTRFSSIDFSLTNSKSDLSLNYALTGNDLRYQDFEVGELNLNATDSAGMMDIQLIANNNVFFENPAHDILLNAHYDNWQSNAEFTVIDDSGKIFYNIELASDLDSNNFVLNIPKQQITLNSQIWEVEDPVMLIYNLADKKVYPSMKMQNDSAFFHFYSTKKDSMHLYTCQFDKVFLESLIRGSMIPGNPSGIISGELNYGLDPENERNINTDLQFNNIEWNDVGFGMISLDGYLRSDTVGNYEMKMQTRIDSSEITVEYYQIFEESRALSTEFHSLPLVIIQPFVSKQVSEMSGSISGDFEISSEGEGEIEGTLNFIGASTRINALNSKFRLPDERIQFAGNRVLFDGFHVLDSLNNNLDINGYIEIDNDWKVYTNLDISSSGLQVMQTSGDDNESFYGDIYLDSRISIIGPLKKPVIKGNLLLARGSEINYRYKEDLSLSESAKYVSFVSSAQEKSQVPQLKTNHSKLFESSIETNLNIDPTTRINFSLSKWAFDIDLGISGGGALSFQMVNNNQYSLSGSYLINDGDANLKLIGWPNKAFRIAEGGFIRWDGRVDNPELKFEAANRVASSYTNAVDGKVRNVDIDVFLKLSNNLSDLDIEFTIFTTDQYLMSIISTLSPEEQMRQAITILLFETIDLPGISSSTSYMTQQVNQLVAAQLNSLTKTTISGIDISFGVNTYVEATEGGAEETKTSLSYDVRKKFADDRAQMSVSGRMNDLYNQTGASSVSLNNISLEYQLDSAASRYLKVYNERSYEDVFEGEVVKTGMGITFRKRYWTLKEIWRRKNKKK